MDNQMLTKEIWMNWKNRWVCFVACCLLWSYYWLIYL